MTAEQIIDLLRQHPNGLTTEEIRVVINAPRDNVSSRLSRLASWGRIRREYVGLPGFAQHCIWRALP